MYVIDIEFFNCHKDLFSCALVMNRIEAESVCDYLRNKEIQLIPNNQWLKSSINWYKTHLELSNLFGSLQEYVCIQWLLADLKDVGHGCLPTDCKDTNTELRGKYPVQINFIRDISQSCYTQLRAVENVNESESNDNVTADEPMKQNWMPNPKRVLMIEVTDGVTVLKAMEYSRIECLTEPFIPGMKAILIGPIECRKGILFLKKHNISLLGGEVDHLYEVNSKVNLLSKCLNLPTNNNTLQDRSRNNPVIRPQSENVPQINRNQVNDLPPPLAHRTEPRVEQKYLENDEIVISDDDDIFPHQLPDEEHSFFGRMSDEDDAFLRDLPDEVLECPDNAMSPVLDQRPVINMQVDPSPQQTPSVSDIRNSSVSSNNPFRMNRPKLFPSVEDLRPVGRATDTALSPSSPGPSVPTGLHHALSTSFSNRIPLDLPSTSTKSKEIENIPVNKNDKPAGQSYESLPGPSSSHFNSTDKYYNKQLKLSNEDFYSEESIEVNESELPKLKRTQVKVESIIKLKIRNSEWNCCADVMVEDKSMNVTFSDKVLEKLFGISASEVEIWRNEMSTNLSLKKKVNDILKAGQTKLKMLNCPMTLEYSSEDCPTPHIVGIDTI